MHVSNWESHITWPLVRFLPTLLHNMKINCVQGRILISTITKYDSIYHVHDNRVSGRASIPPWNLGLHIHLTLAHVLPCRFENSSESSCVQMQIWCLGNLGFGLAPFEHLNEQGLLLPPDPKPPGPNCIWALQMHSKHAHILTRVKSLVICTCIAKKMSVKLIS